MPNFNYCTRFRLGQRQVEPVDQEHRHLGSGHLVLRPIGPIREPEVIPSSYKSSIHASAQCPATSLKGWLPSGVGEV